MTIATDDFSVWLTQARVAEHRLTPDQRGVLFAAFHFRRSRGDDSYSTRLLSHFLLHARTGLKVASIARLVGVSRPTASGQQGRSSKEAVQQAHHRLDGRPYGKLLPRYAGPIAEFLCRRPEATRADLIDFIDQTFDVRVSRIALYHFLKKYGLDRVGAAAASTVPATVTATLQAAAAPPDPPPALPNATPAVATAPPFCSDARAVRARS
jgi:transposase